MNANPTENNFERTLVLTTGHIPAETATALGNHTDETTATYHANCECAPLWDLLTYEPWGIYGWIVWVSAEQAHAARDAGHAELADLIEFAERHTCNFLRLDGDGAAIDGLPLFDW